MLAPNSDLTSGDMNLGLRLVINTSRLRYTKHSPQHYTGETVYKMFDKQVMTLLTIWLASIPPCYLMSAIKRREGPFYGAWSIWTDGAAINR